MVRHRPEVAEVSRNVATPGGAPRAPAGSARLRVEVGRLAVGTRERPVRRTTTTGTTSTITITIISGATARAMSNASMAAVLAPWNIRKGRRFSSTTWEAPNQRLNAREKFA
mgnify:CR=1 FL=1